VVYRGQDLVKRFAVQREKSRCTAFFELNECIFQKGIDLFIVRCYDGNVRI